MRLTQSADPAISTIDAPVDANVWKVCLGEQDTVKPGQLIAILEAMKLEINVNAPDDLKDAKVEKLIVHPGETIRAGEFSSAIYDMHVF